MVQKEGIMTTDELVRIHGIETTTDAVDPHEQPCTYILSPDILSPDGNSAEGIPCVLELGHAGNHVIQVTIIEKGE